MRTPISSIAADGEPEFFSTVKPQASAAPAENTASAAPTPSSAFDGALFIGDSMTTCLKNYVTNGAGSTTALSDAEFMTRSDYSWDEAQNELNGGEGGLWLDDDTALTVTEAIDRFSTTKLYIQLGKEDLTYNDVSDVTSTAQAVISALQTKYPNLEITVQAVTPMLEWIDYQGLSSSTIAQYNEAMQTYCMGKKNLKFLNIAAFCTEGYLPAEYCADPEGLCIHLNDEGCAIWADYLLGNKTPEPSPTPTPTPDPNGDSTDNTDTQEVRNMSELKPRITENGIDYILVGDYYIPDLKLPEEHRPIGKYGRMHREYLREVHPARLNTLTLTGELWTYLADLNEQAQKRLGTIIEQMKAAEGVTEELKSICQMEWVQRCNNIHNRAEEIVLHEMIYS